jgi:O-methyltransferase
MIRGRGFGEHINRYLKSTGYQLVNINRRHESYYQGSDEADDATLAAVRPFTGSSNERILGVRDAVLYVERFGIPGAIVECGVLRGGMMMAAARTLLELNAADRDIYLFDTYEGMTEPSAEDVDFTGESAAALMAQSERTADNIWAYASIEDVQANLRRTGYPEARLHFVKGPVEETLPEQAPTEVAVLRLDTDWYESTRHELEHLIPRLVPNGVLIIDDYGHWKGSRKAVDEFLVATDRPVLLNRTDYTGRMAVVPGPAPRV